MLYNKTIKYSKNFERDYKFYYTYRDRFAFCGSGIIYPEYQEGKDALNAKRAFYEYDTYGKIRATSEPTLLHKLMVCKASVNLNIKMWAEGINEGTFILKEFMEYLPDAPEWVWDAVRQQVKKL